MTHAACTGMAKWNGLAGRKVISYQDGDGNRSRGTFSGVTLLASPAVELTGSFSC